MVADSCSWLTYSPGAIVMNARGRNRLQWCREPVRQLNTTLLFSQDLGKMTVPNSPGPERRSPLVLPNPINEDVGCQRWLRECGRKRSLDGPESRQRNCH